MSENKTICFCKKVDYETIKNAVEGGANTVEKVGEITGAGTKCGRCKSKIQDIIDGKE